MVKLHDMDDTKKTFHTAGDSDRLLSREEVDQRFGIPKRFLELAIAKGNGPKVVRIGRLVRYRVSDIRQWIEEQVSDQ